MQTRDAPSERGGLAEAETPQAGGAAGASPALMAALRALLRPIVRLLITRGVTLPALRQVLKEVYVSTAEAEFGLEGDPPTDSRIALLTGVHRKDVRELRRAANSDAGTGAPAAPALPAAPLAAAVIARWAGDPIYAGDAGPRALPQTGKVSFQSLVASLSKDVRPRTVQDELERLGALTIEEADGGDGPVLRLLAQALVPAAGSEEGYDWLGANSGDHLAAAVHNLLRDAQGPAFLERAVYHGGLTASQVSELEEMARLEAKDALGRLNTHAIALKNHVTTGEQNGERRVHRFRFGAYFYHRQSAAEGSDGASAELDGAPDGDDKRN